MKENNTIETIGVVNKIKNRNIKDYIPVRFLLFSFNTNLLISKKDR